MFYTHPHHKHAHVAIFYRDFKDYGDDYGGEGYKCHRGLGVNALLTAKVLRKNGVRADVAPVFDENAIKDYLKANQSVTHAVIQALWVSSSKQIELCREFPHVHFVVRVHSQISFLQVEPNAIKILRDLLTLQEIELNLTVSANSTRLQKFLESVYKSRATFLPNLYDIERVSRKRDESHHHRTLRIGSFGAHRLLKNHTGAAAAALMIAQRHGSDLEFYVNGGREENIKKDTILQSLQHMFSKVPWAKLVLVPWAEWPDFRQQVAHMDLCMQVSFTETFNLVTADAICEGVPSVVSDAIEWVPDSWMASVDSAEDMARVGAHLLWDTHGVEEGYEHLKRFTHHAIHAWLKYLESNPT